MKKIYSIGYQGRTIKEFLNLLERNDIAHIADVRSYPTSRRDEFCKENLKDTLFHKGMRYKHLPDLGGLDDRDYRKRMLSDRWETAYQELKKLSEDGKTVMMCLEKDPSRCHRQFIVRKLEEDGWDVIHLGKGGSWKKRSLDDFT